MSIEGVDMKAYSTLGVMVSAGTYPDEADVRRGVTYNEDKTGTLDVLPISKLVVNQQLHKGTRVY